MALMSKSSVSSFGPAGAVLMCFLSGCFIFAAGLLNLGKPTNFTVNYHCFRLIYIFKTLLNTYYIVRVKYFTSPYDYQ